MSDASPLVPRTALLTPRGWLAVLAAALVMTVMVPVLHLAVPEGHALHLSAHYVGLFGKILCYAICALAMDLIWGYTGILSLGHGLFFALGGYAMGMYLMREIGSEGQYRLPMPDFMVFLNWKEFPWHPIFCSEPQNKRISATIGAKIRIMKKNKLLVLYCLCFGFIAEAQCWKSVSVGFSHNLAIANNGTLWAWGRNTKRELGTGSTEDFISTPTQVGTDRKSVV